MDIHIRLANTSDLEQINKIEETLEHRIISKSSLEACIKNSNCYFHVATIDNLPVAYILAETLVDHVDILSIAVLEEYRKNNIGKTLLNLLFDYCKKNQISDIFLEVRKSNEIAINFYEKMGFEKISTRKNYYADTYEDAYVYKKMV